MCPCWWTSGRPGAARARPWGPCSKSWKPSTQAVLCWPRSTRYRAAKLAAMFGIRSIPTCVLLMNGQPVDGFTGALPEGKVRVSGRHLPSAEEALAEAEEEPRMLGGQRRHRCRARKAPARGPPTRPTTMRASTTSSCCCNWVATMMPGGLCSGHRQGRGSRRLGRPRWDGCYRFCSYGANPGAHCRI